MSKETETAETKDSIILDLGEGKELDLTKTIQESTTEALKAMGAVDEEGQFKGMAVTVKGDEEAKSEKYANIANFVKTMILGEGKGFQDSYGYKAISTSGGSFGSTVPTELYDEIIEASRRWTVIRDYAFVFQLTGTVQVPKEGTGVTGYWVAENASITEDNPTAGSETLEDHGVASLVKVSWKLLRTSDFNITRFVAQLSAKAITDKEESAFVNGDGSSKPLGILQHTISQAVAQAGGSFAYSDLLALYYTLPVGYRKNAAFLTSGQGMQLVHGLEDSQNRPLFPAGSALDKVFGKPLLESEDVPANLGAGTDETVIVFGDMFFYWIKDGSDIEMATQETIENLQTKIVLYKYVDGAIVNTSAFAKLTGVK